MAEAVVLGSGTSNGVPTLGKDYPPEYLANPKNHRTRPALLLKGPQGNILVDAGPDMRMQLLREGVKDFEAVLITHTHADHVMGLDDVRAISMITGEAMPIYTSPEYQEDIRRIYPYAFADFPPGIWVPRFDLRDVPETLELAGLTLRTFWVEHGPLPVLAFRVNDFAYITDVSRIPEEAMPLLENLDVLILDAVRYRPHRNHFHLEKALEVAAEIGARETFLTHLSDDYDHDKTNSELPEGIALAYDGLRIAI